MCTGLGKIELSESEIGLFGLDWIGLDLLEKNVYINMPVVKQNFAKIYHWGTTIMGAPLFLIYP